VRAVLVVNPHATTTSARVREVLVHALAGAGPHWDVEIAETTHRGHGIEIARDARRNGVDVLMTLGGDGTVNEAVNGLLADGPGDDVPLLAAVPGGSANVFARALGLPANAVEATGAVLEALAEKRSRTIGLGRAVLSRADGSTDIDRWFCFNAGIGVDAEIIAAMERARTKGEKATPVAYLGTAARQIYLVTDRKTPALTMHRPGVPPVSGIFEAIIANTTPWTYLGPYPVRPLPNASFDAGLDVWAPRSLGVARTMNYWGRMLTGSVAGPNRDLAIVHDTASVRFTSTRPIAVQLDGDGLGDVVEAEFISVPAAIRVVC